MTNNTVTALLNRELLIRQLSHVDRALSFLMALAVWTFLTPELDIAILISKIGVFQTTSVKLRLNVRVFMYGFLEKSLKQTYMTSFRFTILGANLTSYIFECHQRLCKVNGNVSIFPPFTKGYCVSLENKPFEKGSTLTVKNLLLQKMAPSEKGH